MLEVFKDCEISGKEDDLNAFLTKLTENLSTPWSRNFDRENESERSMFLSDGKKMYLFSKEKEEKNPAAGLSILADNNSFKIVNVVPMEYGNLTKSEYNSILDNFVETFVKPIYKSYSLSLVVTNAGYEITHWLNEDCAKKLKSFSSCANKSTGSSHPSDKKRWLNFLICVHNSKTEIDSEILLRWFMEEEGWAEDWAWKLCIEFEQGINLLEAYDESPQ